MIIFYKGDYQNDNNELYIFHETNGLGCFIYRYHLYFSPFVHPDSHQSCANHFNESGSVYQSLHTVVERSSYILYLLLGICGLPVFSGFSGGIGKLAGPTGGYLAGFIFLILIAGFFMKIFPKKKTLTILGMVLGMAATYIFGTLWLAAQMELSFTAALSVGVLPYLLGDAVKIAAASIVGPILQNRLFFIRDNN